MKLWFVELFEQKVANQLKYVFMDTQRLSARSVQKHKPLH